MHLSKALKISIAFYPNISVLRLYPKEAFQKYRGEKIIMHKYIMIGDRFSKFIHYVEHYAVIKNYLHKELSTTQKYTLS